VGQALYLCCMLRVACCTPTSAFQQADFESVVVGYSDLGLGVIPIFLLRASVRNLFISSVLR